MKLSRGRLALFSASFSALVAAFVISAPAQAAPQTINLTVDCGHALSVTADVGDTIVFTMTHPGCNQSTNYANIYNVNGTYFSGIGSGYEGTATGSGFLDYVSHTQGTVKTTDYWHSHGGQDDWFVMQTLTGGQDVEITTTLRTTDGNGAALQVGSNIAEIYTQVGGNRPVEYLVTYAGPRTSNNSNSSSSSPSPTAAADSAALASTGQNHSTALAISGVAALLLVVGAALVALRKHSKPE
jgi:LPXTG-motif cell wall-anchored protein